MKTEAYVCDFCNELRHADEVVGVSAQNDMFDKMAGFPTIPNPGKAHIHLCTTCYNLYVVSVAERETNRKTDEHAYTIKLKEMAYLVKSQCVTNYNKKIQKKKGK